MIRLRLAASSFTQIRFGFSPISELADSLSMLHSARLEPLYRDWGGQARQRMRGLDHELLRAIVPHRGVIPDFPQGAAGIASTIEQQLKLLADWEPDLLRAELRAVWHGTDLPPAAEQLIAAGPAWPAWPTFSGPIGKPRWNRTGPGCERSSRPKSPTVPGS